MKDKFVVLLCIVFFVTGVLFAGGQGEATEEEMKEAAENYPTKPVELIIPYSPGGASDILGRAIVSTIEPHLGQPMVSVIKSGAAGSVGAKYAAEAKPNGYKVLLASPGSNTVQPQMADVGYDIDDFISIGRITVDPHVLVVKSGTYDTFEDFVEYGKENPGELSIGHSGTGSMTHLGVEALADEVGIEVNPIPFGGGGPNMTALLGGEIDASNEHPPTFLSNVEAGKLKPLVTLLEKRLTQWEAYKDTPTAQELGYDVTISSWKAVLVPKGTPPKIVEYLRTAFKDLMEDESFQAMLERTGNMPAYLSGPEFREIWEKEYETVGKLIEKLDLKEN